MLNDFMQFLCKYLLERKLEKWALSCNKEKNQFVFSSVLGNANYRIGQAPYPTAIVEHAFQFILVLSNSALSLLGSQMERSLHLPLRTFLIITDDSGWESLLIINWI